MTRGHSERNPQMDGLHPDRAKTRGRFGARAAELRLDGVGTFS